MMQQQTQWRYFTINFLITFIPLSVFLSVLLFYIYSSEISADSATLRIQERSKLSIKLAAISKEYKSISSDLMMISNLHTMKRVLDEPSFVDIHRLEEDLLSISSNKKMYDQIRYIDETGLEVVRINFNNGKPSVVPTDKLQNKAKRYYFKDTFMLNKNEVFVSPLDLNIEHGKIELPLKPMIRFGTPIFSQKGKKEGVLILNYFGRILIRSLQKNPRESPGLFSFLNSEGYWLKGPDPEDEWGFMYENRKDRAFSRKYPRAWQKIQFSDSGQFNNDNGLFTFATYYPLPENHKSSTGTGRAFSQSTEGIEGEKYFFKIVSHMPRPLLHKNDVRIFLNLLKLYVFIILIFFIGSWIFAHFRETRRKAEQDKERLINDLQKALAEVKILHGIIPICSYCKQIRDDEGAWDIMEVYITEHTDAEFSHGICPKCYKNERVKIDNDNSN